MTYREAQKEHHLRQLASLFEGDPGGGKYGRNVYPFVLQAPEKNLLASVREEVLLYFNGHLPGAEGTVHFWNPGGEKVVAGHVCSLPTGHLLSSQVACLNHLFPLCRDGKASTLLLRELHPAGVLHCFSGSVEMARELLRRGWYLGFDGPITYKNAAKAPEVIAACPAERILLETDSPYLAPVPNRGKRNDSRNLPFIAARVAEIKGMTIDQVAEVTLQNGKKLFDL